ncbi:hypothetical protein [Aquisalinus luteolus]|uniref:Uncharacterized protein n=1 Tax=Aquisalinus luteolus TaxID=1566827 RepID=A0A8J3A2A3_9PROT|nr:hypothetical protein [Aquisalinus luteolus]GGH97687.1 hypothetical protein GCM10011355_19510 [Aquisalinus luteolus]
MPYKRTSKFGSIGGFVNVLATLTIVFLVSAGYFGALSGMPVTL